MSKIFKHKDFEITIFVEDTDFKGIVYHANYIKYFEPVLNDNQFNRIVSALINQ